MVAINIYASIFILLFFFLVIELPEEALQIAMKRREAKSEGEKERYSHLNAEFQRIARREKKAFLRDQCK